MSRLSPLSLSQGAPLLNFIEQTMCPFLLNRLSILHGARNVCRFFSLVRNPSLFKVTLATFHVALAFIFLIVVKYTQHKASILIIFECSVACPPSPSPWPPPCYFLSL